MLSVNDSGFSGFVFSGIFIGVVDTFTPVCLTSANANVFQLHENGFSTGFVDFSKYLQRLFYIFSSLRVRKGRSTSTFISRMFFFYIYINVCFFHACIL